jgi:hypothetical protein
VAPLAELILPPRQALPGSDHELRANEIEPSTCSVTGCSTCRRVFISRK